MSTSHSSCGGSNSILHVRDSSLVEFFLRLLSGLQCFQRILFDCLALSQRLFKLSLLSEMEKGVGDTTDEVIANMNNEDFAISVIEVGLSIPLPKDFVISSPAQLVAVSGLRKGRCHPECITCEAKEDLEFLH